MATQTTTLNGSSVNRIIPVASRGSIAMETAQSPIIIPTPGTRDTMGTPVVQRVPTSNLPSLEPLPRVSTSSPENVAMIEKKRTCRAPWKEPFKCPLWIYTILVILGLVGTIITIASLPSTDKNGDPISASQRWVSGTFSIMVGLLLALGFGWWMRKECKMCNFGRSWIIMLAAVIVPLLIWFVTLVIFMNFVGIEVNNLF